MELEIKKALNRGNIVSLKGVYARYVNDGYQIYVPSPDNDLAKKVILLQTKDVDEAVRKLIELPPEDWTEKRRLLRNK